MGKGCFLYAIVFLFSEENEDITSDNYALRLSSSFNARTEYYQASLLLVCYNPLEISEENEDITSDMPCVCPPPSMLKAGSLLLKITLNGIAYQRLELKALTTSFLYAIAFCSQPPQSHTQTHIHTHTLHIVPYNIN